MIFQREDEWDAKVRARALEINPYLLQLTKDKQQVVLDRARVVLLGEKARSAAVQRAEPGANTDTRWGLAGIVAFVVLLVMVIAMVATSEPRKVLVCTDGFVFSARENACLAGYR